MEDLENKVLARTAALAQANERLKQEIEDHRSTEKALRLNEAQLAERRKTARAMLDATLETVLLLDPDGIILDLNATATARLGENLVGRSVFNCFPQAVSENRRANLRQVVMTQKPARFEDQWNGRVFDSSFYPVSDEQDRVCEVAVYARDITREKRAQDQIIESERLYRLLAENVTDMISKHTPQGVYSYVSPACRDMLGYAPEDLLGRSAYEFFHPDDLPAVRESHAARLHRPQIQTFGYRLRKKDGDYLWAETTSRAVRKNSSGRIQELLAVTRDITERKRAEDTLKIYKNIVFSTADGIAFLDRDYRYVIVNHAYEKFSGMRQEQFIGRSVADYLGEEAFQRLVKANLDRCLQGEIVGYRDWFEYPALGRRFVDVTYFPYRDEREQIIGVVANTRDMTDYKRAEDARLESEERWRVLVESAPMPILVLRLGKYLYGNPAAARLLGYAHPDEFVGCDALQTFAPEFRDLIQARMQQIENGADNPPAELRIIRPDQTYAWVSSTSVSLQMDGQPTAVIVGQDITERKHAEVALRTSESRLRRMSVQLLQAQDNARQRLATELHDELGQALMVLKLRLRHMHNQLGSDQADIKASAGDAMKYIEEISERVRWLSHDLHPVILEDLGLEAAVRRLIEEATRHTATRVYAEIEDIRGAIRGEQQITLYRIIQEALTNALKHARARKIWVRINRRGNDLRCQVEDCGQGFALENDRTNRSSLRGLGLTIMKERARMLGGELEILSREGAGTCITLSMSMQTGVN